MSGYDIYKKALVRLGLEKFDQKYYEVGFQFLNEIAADLRLGELKSLSDDLILNDDLRETMLTGLLMLLSLNIGDTIQNNLYTDLYNAKRAKVLSSNETVIDVFPTAKESV